MSKQYTYDELLTLYEKQTKRLDKIIKISDSQAKQLFEFNEKLKEMAYLEPMTGIHNRRYFFEVSEKAIALAQRENKAMSLAMIDIDKFKNINDTFGHDLGDTVIKTLAHDVKHRLRKSDVFARLGGEEFIILFPNTNGENAKIICEKLRSMIEDLTIEEKIKFTISIGVSEFTFQSDTLKSVIKKADNALYRAKQNGRNQVQLLN